MGDCFKLLQVVINFYSECVDGNQCWFKKQRKPWRAIAKHLDFKQNPISVEIKQGHHDPSLKLVVAKHVHAYKYVPEHIYISNYMRLYAFKLYYNYTFCNARNAFIWFWSITIKTLKSTDLWYRNCSFDSKVPIPLNPFKGK